MSCAVDIEQIVEDLYAGTLNDEVWQRALRNTTQLASGASALLLALVPGPNGVSIVREENHGLALETLKANRNYWASRDIRIRYGADTAKHCGQFESKFMRLQEWRRTEIYNDFLLDADVPYALAYWLNKSESKMSAFVVQGTSKRGPFDEKDDRRLRPLMPHLQRALEIRDRLEANNIRMDSLSACVDSLSFGAFVLDDVGRLLEVNARGQYQLRTESAIRCEKDGTLWMRGPAGLELQRWIFTGASSATTSDGVIRVHRPDQRQPLSVLIAPMKSEPVSWIARHPRWLVLVFDPELKVQPSSTALATELGISVREAELAALLSIGLRLDAAAQRLHISLSTARAHLKSIFSKTDIHSQTELVRRSLTSAAALGMAKHGS